MAESLPEEILIEILLRVPAESLVRFKLVCKRWRSLISDPGFARSHLRRLKAGDLIPRQRILIGSRYQTIDYKTLDANEGCVAISHKIKTINSDSNDSNWQIVGFCDGLVCFLVSGGFLIYNPTTREYRELPSSDLDRENGSFYGFGYDPRSDDYKIVEGIREYAYDFWSTAMGVAILAIFSLKSGSWRRISFEIPFSNKEIEEIAESRLNDVSGNGVYWKGALHWHVSGWGESGILSLDLSEEKFHRVLSAPEVERDGLSRGLGIHGTSLFIYSCYGNHIHTWITDEYRRGGLWTNWFSVDCLDVRQVAIPLVCTSSGKIVFLLNWDQLILFNLEDNTYKDYPYKDDPDRFCFIEYAIYLETLISPYLS